MNIFLIPYTWLRHLSMAFWCAGAGLVAWWVALAFVVTAGAFWTPSMDGLLLMCLMAASVAGASILGEGNLRRTGIMKRMALVVLGAGLSLVFTAITFTLWDSVGAKVLFSGAESAVDAGDASLVSLRYRLGGFAMAGLSTGLGPVLVRKLASPMSHLLGGMAAGLAAGVVWHVFNYSFGTDLYLAGAAMGATWGGTFGLLAWAVPDRLYAGWLRVLTPTRFGRRIPVDALDGSPKERFIGHFPSGL